MTSPESTHSLTVERVYSASPERVFAAWIDPEILRRWYAPVDGWVVSHAESDPRPGGEYRISFGPAPDGNTYTEHGTYEVVEPGQLLRWRLELSGTSIECTVVEVSFEAVADGTLVRIVESGYTTEASADEHSSGWATTLAHLAQLLT